MTKIIFIILTLILSGCGQGEISGAKNQEKSIGQFFSSMEANGSYPVLDRTDTLAGIDANHNGIRDDIDLYISKQGYTTQDLKFAKQYAKSIQNEITIDINNSYKVAKVKKEIIKALCCMSNLTSAEYGVSKASLIVKELESYSTNTRVRLKSYLTFDQTFSGSVFSLSDQKDACEN